MRHAVGDRSGDRIGPVDAGSIGFAIARFKAFMNPSHGKRVRGWPSVAGEWGIF
jgi:hypothetical protein